MNFTGRNLVLISDALERATHDIDIDIGHTQGPNWDEEYIYELKLEKIRFLNLKEKVDKSIEKERSK